jgi:hypothetical protein
MVATGYGLRRWCSDVLQGESLCSEPRSLKAAATGR